MPKPIRNSWLPSALMRYKVNPRPEGGDMFMEVRGIAAWNEDRSFDWKQRGTEQVAEIITWGLGEGEIARLLPEITDPETLARALPAPHGTRPDHPGCAVRR